ncbi:MAG: hypothetical protein J5998_04800, partial [Clostridia bacterium]|nr:hypothetical protein [Clostridia bacterium]
SVREAQKRALAVPAVSVVRGKHANNMIAQETVATFPMGAGVLPRRLHKRRAGPCENQRLSAASFGAVGEAVARLPYCLKTYRLTKRSNADAPYSN